MPPHHRPNPTGELALIDRIRARAALLPQSPELALGIGDDCAILRPQPGEELVVTTDFCLEDRHWTRAWNPPASAGHRTLARGLSDLAAMGARPVAAFLSLSLPPETARDTAPNGGWLDAFLDGLLTLAAEYRIPLAGGDTSQSPSPHVLADIVCLGACPTGSALRRSTARPGDSIYVTGTLGGSYAERTRIASGAALPITTSHPFLYPQPRLATGQALRERNLATACIDLSDGLSTDLHHLCEVSGVAAELDLSALPASPWLRPLPASQRQHAMLHGGEDYELLFTASPNRIPARLAGVRLTRIGAITRFAKSRPTITAIGPEGRNPLQPQGWEHLQ